MRASFSTSAKRTKPSPERPKPTPGLTATLASVSSSLLNSSDPRLRQGSGIGAHTNIVPRGLRTGQPMRARPSHSTSRRWPVSYTHLRAHETRHDLVCRLLLEKKKKKSKKNK